MSTTNHQKLSNKITLIVFQDLLLAVEKLDEPVPIAAQLKRKRREEREAVVRA
tara:strand:- start:763 stop:921 length:159 start_codon:yes stop_codon:yes gene_type:complete